MLNHLFGNPGQQRLQNGTTILIHLNSLFGALLDLPPSAGSLVEPILGDENNSPNKDNAPHAGLGQSIFDIIPQTVGSIEEHG